MLRQRELNEDSVDLFVGVELIDKSVELVLCGILIKTVDLGIKSYLGTRLFFISYVDLGCGIFSYENDCKSRCSTVFLF